MAVNKFYIFGGCSFTDMPNSWARVIQRDVLKERNCRNVSKSGAGNTFISTAVIDCALKAEAEGYTPDISVMWSAPSRIEFPMHEKETPHAKMMFKGNEFGNNDMNPGLFAFDGLTGDFRRAIDNYWILNGGAVSEKTQWSWNKNVDMQFVKAFQNYAYYFWNQHTQWHNTLTAYLLVQNMAEARGWTYRASTFRDYVKDYKTWCADQFVTLQNAVNWNKFKFTDDHTGGLREYTLNNLNTWDDGYDNHPSYEAHEDFVNNFWLKHFKGVYEC